MGTVHKRKELMRTEVVKNELVVNWFRDTSNLRGGTASPHPSLVQASIHPRSNGCSWQRMQTQRTGTNSTDSPWGWIQTRTTDWTQVSRVYRKLFQHCGFTVTTTILWPCMTSHMAMTLKGIFIWVCTTSWAWKRGISITLCTAHVRAHWSVSWSDG